MDDTQREQAKKWTEQLTRFVDEKIEDAIRPLAAYIDELERRVADLERSASQQRAMRPDLDA